MIKSARLDIEAEEVRIRLKKEVLDMEYQHKVRMSEAVAALSEVIEDVQVSEKQSL
jgi:hypothetical protein